MKEILTATKVENFFKNNRKKLCKFEIIFVHLRKY